MSTGDQALKALTEAMTQLLVKLESRMERIEGSLEQHTLSINALSASVDKNFVSLESTVKDVVRSVQLLKDKQELFEAQQEIARATINTTTTNASRKVKEEEPEEIPEDSEEEDDDDEEEEEEEEVSEESEEEQVPKKQTRVTKRRSTKEAAKPKRKNSVEKAQQQQQGQFQKPAGSIVNANANAGGQGRVGSSVPIMPAAPVFHPGSSGFAPAPAGPTFQPRPNQFSPRGMQAPPVPSMPGQPPHHQQQHQQHQQQMNPGSYSQPPPGPPPSAQPPAYTHAGLPAPVLPPPPPYGRPPVPGGPPGPPSGPPPPGPSPPPREQAQVSSNRVPIEKVVEDVSAMGFTRQAVRDVVRRLTENGQSVDLNIVLDQLMNGPSSNSRERGGQQQQWYAPSTNTYT